jgi:hypothetical protein
MVILQLINRDLVHPNQAAVTHLTHLLLPVLLLSIAELLPRADNLSSDRALLFVRNRLIVAESESSPFSYT